MHYPLLKLKQHFALDQKQACKGILSEQLISMKEQSMTILKDYITKHNVPNEVPDEPEEFSSEDDGEIPEQPPVKSKKRK